MGMSEIWFPVKEYPSVSSKNAVPSFRTILMGPTPQPTHWFSCKVHLYSQDRLRGDRVMVSGALVMSKVSSW